MIHDPSVGVEAWTPEINLGYLSREKGKWY